MSSPALAIVAAAALDGALELLGPNGSHWTRGELWRDSRAGVRSWDAEGACMAAAPTFEAYELARDTLRDVVGRSVIEWNNDPRVGWAAVVVAFVDARDQLAAES